MMQESRWPRRQLRAERKACWSAKAALLCALCLMLTLTATAQKPSSHLQMGGNVNEHLDWLQPSLLDQSHATWIRGFVPASEFIGGQRSFASDPGLLALKAAAKSGHKIVLSIKWDCTGNGRLGRVPAPESGAERQWFAFTDKLLETMTGSVSVLVLENELFIDTQEADLVAGSDGQIPMVRFLQRLAQHVSSENPIGADGKPLLLYAGGFTRLDRYAGGFSKKEALTAPALRAMIYWINKDPRIAGADFHVHQPDMDSSRRALEFMHQQIPHKPLMVTEYSLVWKWKAHLADQIGASAGGAAFARKYSLAPKMRVYEFLNAAFAQPVSEGEWQEFLASQPWFEPQYLDQIGQIMEANGVTIATYGLLTQNPQAPSGVKPRQITTETTPWFINNLFVPGVAYRTDHLLPVTFGLYDSFVRWQTRR